MQRTDIRQSDVFISWTGKDRELKDRIISYLRQNNIVCTESDHYCAGDFRQWSREVVGKSTVFLLLYTENTVNSEFVPVEIEELRKLDDYRNRCVPVVTDYSLYEKNLPDLAESESAVMFDGHELAEEHLEKILYNVQALISNRLCKVYCKATKPTYLRLVSMLKAMRVADREFDHNRLYIDRTVTDENGEEFASAAGFTNTEDIIFLQGPAGSGKSCYIDQLRNAADDQTLVMSLSCRKLVDATDLFSVMFEEFKRYCGNRQFYTSENFKSLLSVRHLLLVLDGMDEIATEKGTRKFLNIIKDYYDVNSDSTTLFFTSRNESDADLIAMNGQTPRKLILRSLDEDQIKVFGSNLFLMLGSSDKSDDFYVRVQELADEIRTNPLLLSQLAIVYDKKSEIPQTTVGIYDAVCEITMSREDDVADVPDDYREMVTRRLPDILKSFSAERYRLLSLGKQIDTGKILTVILKNEYTDARDRAAFLKEYLQNRAMLVDGEFYHKMLLEYFTATYYYEQCFNDYDEIENSENIKNLFDHYSDPYWSAVLQMFLVKADSLIDNKTTTELYRELMTYGIEEYTLLFDTCRDLIRYKEEAQSVLIYDILQKSANGVYPPYGPLFWYVPEYNLYENLLITLDSVKESDFFTKALALTRDVCWIFGRYNTVDEITDRIDVKSLLEIASLSGVRQGLCELFFTGNTDSILGDDIYPRCFNIEEAKSFKKNGCGVIGRMSTPFADELDLFSHTSYNELNGEFIGLISCSYMINEIETELAKHSCRKLNGLILSPSDNTKMEYIAFNRTHIEKVYVPENITCFLLSFETEHPWNMYMTLSLGIAVLSGGLLYYSSDFSLPDGIKEISPYAFYDNLILENICLPPSVNIICEGAFLGCYKLKTINIPDSIMEIRDSAFWGCCSLISIKIPNGVMRIGKSTFDNCGSLITADIPKKIKEIGDNAFSRCVSLKSVNIPDGVTCIGEDAFCDCSSLTSLIIPGSVTKIGSRSFKNCISLTSVKIFDGVTKIGYEAFCGCHSLTSIVIPDSVTQIDTGAFDGCNGLLSVEISARFKNDVRFSFYNVNPDIITFRPLADTSSALIKKDIDEKNKIAISCDTTLTEYKEFNNYNKDIKSIVISETINKIEDFAFMNWISLTSVYIPNNVTEIGSWAFENCISLSTIDIPDSVTKICKNAFCGCTSLASVKFPKSATGIEIEEEAFKGCTSLMSVDIPDGLIKIDRETFFDCSSLISVNIPDSVTEIGFGAFSGCVLLKSIDIHDKIEKIQDCSFFNCNSLISIKIPANVKKIGGFTFFNCNSITSAKISDGVLEIAAGAFQGCSSLHSIEIPSSVRIIGGDAFCGCTGLREITISRRFEDDLPRIFSGVDLSQVKINWL